LLFKIYQLWTSNTANMSILEMNGKIISSCHLRFLPDCTVLFSINHDSFCFPERDYYSLCVKQPIGNQLFRLFCATKYDLQHCINLLDETVLSLIKYWV